MIIDGTDLILGRLSAFAAKKALQGENIDIVNSEDVVITGDKKTLLARYSHRRDRGTPTAGPFFPRQAHLILKRTIRGMLPYKQAKGMEAFKRIRCHRGVPSAFDGKQFETLEKSNASKLETQKFLTLGQLSKLLGAK